MTGDLQEISYGKSRVRVAKITRYPDRHDFSELTVDVRLDGAFEGSYLTGDNKRIVATDTMKNVVQALAGENPIDPIETFGRRLGRHFLDVHQHVTGVQIKIRERKWLRLDEYAYEQSQEQRLAHVTATREDTVVESGVGNLVLLKTTKSRFEGYIKDRHTTLLETKDRILATSITALWRHRDPNVDFNTSMKACRQALVGTFAGHESRAVQQTLYAMGEALLACQPSVDRVHLSLPNKHYLPVDLSPFGIENRNEIFLPVDEPHGLIEATLTRVERPPA